MYVYIKCCRNQVGVSGFKRSFEDGEAGEGGRGKNFADVVPYNLTSQLKYED